MSDKLPIIYLGRHGETAWTLSRQHTGLTDLPLTERGEHTARRLGERLKGLTFAKVLTSPLKRAARTCELAGFGAVAEVDRDLVEWDYGQYEGRRSDEIRAERPDWQLFRDGVPEENRPGKSVCVLTALCARCAQFPGTSCCFRAGTSFGCWLPAGSGLNQRPTADSSC